MKLLKLWLLKSYRHKGSLVLGVILGLSLVSIYRSLRAPADTVARASDIEKAKRIESAPSSQPLVKNSPVKDEAPTLNGVAANGIMEPIGGEILLASEVPGVIAEVKVKEGQPVKKGDVLISFRSTIEQAQIVVAEAELKTVRAKAQLAQRTLQRTRKLSRDQVATEEELDRDEKTLTMQSAQVLAAEARLQQANAALERLSILAPMDGAILKINYQQGEYYNPLSNEALLVMGDVTRLRIKIELDERDLARVKVGSRGYFIADAYGSEKFLFTLTEFGRRMGKKNLKSDDPRERNDTRVLTIYGVVEAGSADQLIPGLRVTAFLPAAVQPLETSH